MSRLNKILLTSPTSNIPIPIVALPEHKSSGQTPTRPPQSDLRPPVPALSADQYGTESPSWNIGSDLCFVGSSHSSSPQFTTLISPSSCL